MTKNDKKETQECDSTGLFDMHAIHTRHHLRDNSSEFLLTTCWCFSRYKMIHGSTRLYSAKDLLGRHSKVVTWGIESSKLLLKMAEIWLIYIYI